MTENALPGPIPDGRASDADLSLVARNLDRWQDLVAQQRQVPAPWAQGPLEERGLMPQIQAASAARRELLDKLLTAYGEAVARVPGAQDEDLVALYQLGLLRSDAPDEAEEATDPVPAAELESGSDWLMADRRYQALTLEQEGFAALRREDWAEAARCLTWAVEGGYLDPDVEAEAMRGLGCALDGQGDHVGAERWFARAAEAGDQDAAVMLGLALAQKNKTVEAIRWLTPAAEAGHVRAMCALGVAWRQRGSELIDRGLLTDARQAPEQSWFWIRKAAAAGDPIAAELVADADARRRESALAAARQTKVPAKGGCYIATAVYGSYDAAPVVTLRRFRDERLARSAAGRALISRLLHTQPATSQAPRARRSAESGGQTGPRRRGALPRRPPLDTPGGFSRGERPSSEPGNASGTGECLALRAVRKPCSLKTPEHGRQLQRCWERRVRLMIA